VLYALTSLPSSLSLNCLSSGSNFLGRLSTFEAPLVLALVWVLALIFFILTYVTLLLKSLGYLTSLTLDNFTLIPSAGE
jgi:hypothetical protein